MRDKRITLVLIFGILLLSATIRFYKLDVPSMWLDEIVVALASEKPLEYVHERALTGVDTHPPFYHFFAKAISHITSSEIMLRAPSALAGLLAIALIFIASKKYFSRRSGLIAACLLSVNHLHILLSREVRPYSLIALFSLLSLIITLDYVQTKKPVLLLCLFISNLCFSGLQFLTLLIMGAQCFVVCTALFIPSYKIRLKHVVLFSLCSISAYIPNLQYLSGKFGADLTADRWDVLRIYFENLIRTMSLEPGPLAYLVVIAFLSMLVPRYKQTRNQNIIFLAAYVLIPVVPLVCVKYNSYFNPWHLSFLIAPLTMLVSEALCYVFDKLKIFTYAFSVAYLAMVVVIFHGERFYRVESHSGKYKQLSNSVGSLNLDGVFLTTDSQILDGISWYNRQKGLHDPWINSNTEHKEGDITLNILTFDGFAHFARDAPEFKEKYGKNASTQAFPFGCLYKIQLNPTPIEIYKYPFSAATTAEPLALFTHVPRFGNITLVPFFGFKVIPLADDVPAFFEQDYMLENPVDDLLIKADVSFVKMSRDDAFSIWYKFDDDAFSEAAISCMESEQAQNTTLLLKTNRPRSRMTLRFSMQRKSKLPGYTNTRNDTVSFNSLNIYMNTIHDERFISSTYNIQRDGIYDPEHDELGDYSWAYGPRTTLAFTLDKAEPATLEYALNNPVPNQDVDVYCNGTLIGSHRALACQNWLSETVSNSIKLSLPSGHNTIEFLYRAWNHSADPSATFAPQDGRPMAVAFKKLLITRTEELSAEK